MNSRLDILRVSPGELTDRQLLLLRDIVKASYYQDDLGDVVRAIVEGQKQLWRITGPKAVDWIILVTVVQCAKWKELWIWGLAGTGYIKTGDEVYPHIARANGCKTIGGMTKSEGLMRLYRQRKNITEYKTFLWEIVS